jgi:hypothetical protein
MFLSFPPLALIDISIGEVEGAMAIAHVIEPRALVHAPTRVPHPTPTMLLVVRIQVPIVVSNVTSFLHGWRLHAIEVFMHQRGVLLVVKHVHEALVGKIRQGGAVDLLCSQLRGMLIRACELLHQSYHRLYLHCLCKDV